MKEKEVKKLYCKCCGESFETSRSDKVYLNKRHQVKHNNQVQYEKIQRLNPLQLRERQTYLIYLRLLGDKEIASFTREFLRGAGADLSLLNRFTTVNGNNQMSLFDVLIIFNSENQQLITLKRQKS
jgi:hypothetical protein